MKPNISKKINTFKYKGEPIKMTLGTLLLMCFCILLLIMATFTQISLTHPYISLNIFMNDDSNISTSFIKVYKYVPQIPVVFFIIALLGRKFGIITILGYILLGMFFPIFALGGGISYLFEFGFGYILAFIPSVFLTGTLLKIKTDFLRIVLMGVLGVLSIHILGTLYMLFITTLRHTPSEIILGWISAQSGAKIFYDMIFSIMALYIGRWSKRLLWLALC